MQDEHFMRGWNDGHDRFSADITRGLKRLAARFRRLGKRPAAPTFAAITDQESPEIQPKPAST